MQQTGKTTKAQSSAHSLQKRQAQQQEPPAMSSRESADADAGDELMGERSDFKGQQYHH